MFPLASIAAFVVAVSSGSVTLSAEDSVPRGVGCDVVTDLALRSDHGIAYMSGSGKMTCMQTGVSSATAVLHKNGEEVARRKIDTLDTNALAAVTVPCTNGSADVRWLLVVQYSDELVGMTIQHRFADNRCG
jgi:hypothetical protein